MHIVRVHGHLLRVDEFVHHWLAIGRLRMGHQSAMVRPLRVVAHGHLLGRGSIG